MKPVLLFLALALATIAQAQGNNLNLSKGLALQGYDAVAYFDNKAVEGSATYTFQLAGATYRFASAAHRNAFRANPARYLPQYGGWCAYAMGAKGEKVDVDPETFKILDGKLYLFYNRYFTNTLKSWNKDEANLRAKADQNWARLTNQ